MEKLYIFQLDFIIQRNYPRIECVQGDTGNVFQIELFMNNDPVELEGKTATITFKKGDTNIVVGAAENIGKNIIKYKPGTQEINYPGNVIATVELYEGTTRLTTTQFGIFVREQLKNGTEVESTTEYPVLTELIDQVQTLYNNIPSNEVERIASEDIRKANEVERVTSEDTRVASEVVRQENEAARIVRIAEMEQVDAVQFKARQDSFDTQLAESQTQIGLKATAIDLGNKSNLPTTDKSSFEKAINELYLLILTKLSQTQINSLIGFADINKNLSQIDATMLTAELLAMIAGTAGVNVTPSALSVLTGMLANNAVTEEKLSFTPAYGVKSKNLFNKSTATVDKYVNYLDGTLITSVGYSASDFIAVLPSTQYTKNDSRQFAYYDVNKTYISGVNNGVYTFTTPANAYFVRLTFYTNTLDYLQLETGSLPTSYESFGNKVDANILKNFNAFNGIPSKNLFNKATINADKYVSHTSGNLVTSVGYNTSDFIPLLPNTTYTKKTNERYVIYDAYKAFVVGSVSDTTFTTPANGVYIRFTTLTANLDIEQLELGSVSTDYDNYGNKLDYTKIPNKAISKDMINMIPVEGLYSKNLFNKANATVGYYINYPSGNPVANAIYSASEFIPVLPNTTYTKVTTQQMAFYNSSKVFISGLASATTFTTPANCYYVRITVETSVIDIEQLELGSVGTAYVSYGIKLDEKYIPSTMINAVGYNDFKIELPDDIYLVSGESFSIYYNNIIKYSQKFRKGNYYITHILQNGGDVTATKGKGYSYKWEYTPTTSETFSMEFAIYETYTGAKISSKIVNFHVADSSLVANHGRTANVVTVGDSFVDGYGVSGEIYNFITQNGGINNVNMIGKRDTSNVLAKDDAVSGWGYKVFNTLANVGAIVNPFYNPNTSAFDFAYYMAQNFPTYTPSGQAGEHIDAFLSIMGLNDVIWRVVDVSEYKTYVQNIITSVHAYDPAIKILLSTVTPQPIDDMYTNDGGGYPNNGVSSERAKYLQEKWNEAILTLEDIANNIYLIPTNAHFDTRSSVLTTTVYPDKFNPTVGEIQTNSIHPNPTGAKYIADAYYQAIYNLVLR